ncbi:MAG: 3'-5' exonuclease domain-containing protein 2 [Desulfobulbus sp.]|nr:3'-5' exonuclease domain-containing protein 2 [Desulfobulbus sp.]
MVTKDLTERPTQRISKEAINDLPLARWEGPIRLIRTPEEAKQAAAELACTDLLGFDTETRPAFHKGQKFPPSLLQLATADEVLLFQLRTTGLPAPLRDILSTADIVKAGVAVAFDLQTLQEIRPFGAAGFVDLAQVARRRGIANRGLRGLAAVVCGIRISKTARTTNWANPDLSPQQIQYAATDAWISREIYLRLAKKS